MEQVSRRWLEASTVAADHDLDVSAHCAPAVTLAAAAAKPRLRHIEWFHDHVPGNGLGLRTDVEPYRVA